MESVAGTPSETNRPIAHGVATVPAAPSLSLAPPSPADAPAVTIRPRLGAASVLKELRFPDPDEAP